MIIRKTGSTTSYQSPLNLHADFILNQCTSDLTGNLYFRSTIDNNYVDFVKIYSSHAVGSALGVICLITYLVDNRHLCKKRKENILIMKLGNLKVICKYEVLEIIACS